MAKQVLDSLKFAVIQGLPEFAGISSEGQYQQRLNDFKFEMAQEVGIPLTKGYNGNLKSRDAGVIGGHIGGKIGGNMVREMIKAYEASLF